jgi:hypothetical protein
VIRLAALSLLAAQAILLLLLYRTDGDSAILFTFVGTPLLVVGLLLLLVVGVRQRRPKTPGAH